MLLLLLLLLLLVLLLLLFQPLLLPLLLLALRLPPFLLACLGPVPGCRGCRCTEGHAGATQAFALLAASGGGARCCAWDRWSSTGSSPSARCRGHVRRGGRGQACGAPPTRPTSSYQQG